MTDPRPAPQPGPADPVRRASGAAWDLRLVRAVPFALLCTLIAAAGHRLAGGGDVDVTTLGAGFAAVCALAALLGGRERSLPGIATTLGLGQLGLHLLFHCFGSHAMSATGATGAMSGMTMDQVAGRLICNDAPGAARMLPAGVTPEQLIGNAGLDPHAYQAAASGLPWWQFGLTPAMLAGHLLAAVVAGWWLRRGEAALWRLVRLAAAAGREVQEWAAPLRTAFELLAALLRGLLGEIGTDVRAARPDEGGARLPMAAVLRHSVIRRGPPAMAFAR